MALRFCNPAPRAYHGSGRSSRGRLTTVASFQNPYTALGLSATADAEQIKKAYRKLALKWHPDVSKQEGSEVVFLQLTEAYEFLMGKLHNKDGKECSSSDWDFHDWYWSFRSSRTWGKQQQQPGNETSPGKQQRPKAAGSANIREQLAGLRQRAAIRATKARNACSMESYAEEVEESAPADYSSAVSHTHFEQPASQNTKEVCEANVNQEYCHAQAASQGEDHLQQQHSSQAGPTSQGTSNRRKFVSHSGTRDQVLHQLAGLRRKAAITQEDAYA